MSELENFEGIHFDILKELGNIGSGNAVTSLSKIIGKKVDMRVPIVNLVDFKDTASFVGGPENIIIGILVNISGDVNGIMMFIIEREPARTLTNIIFGQNKTMNEDFDEMELSALKEIGNIMAGSYLSSLASLMNKRINPSIPYLSIDMANAILSVPAIEFSKVADKVLFIESVFKTESMDVSGYFILVPDMPSFKIMLSSLGVQ